MKVFILEKEYDNARFTNLGVFTSRAKAQARLKKLFPEYDFDWSNTWTPKEEYNEVEEYQDGFGEIWKDGELRYQSSRFLISQITLDK